MPKKYHIDTKKIPPRLPKTGKFGIVDWREDCARCHNCVKKACVYDRYRQEMQYIKDLEEFSAMFFECMGCFSCVQKCTKGLLALTVNPEYERMGNGYYTPDIILTTWNQAETAGIPVSGAGYRGKFTGAGFDSMWTDMSEIVRPTRDGIHGREYISTSVDIGRKPRLLSFENGRLTTALPPLVDLPVPIIIDMFPEEYRFPNLMPMLLAVAVRTGTMVIVDWERHGLPGTDEEKHLSNIIFHIGKEAPLPPPETLKKVRLIEIADSEEVEQRIEEIKAVNPGLVVAVRVELDARGENRSIELAHNPVIEVIHIVSDINGNQTGVEKPRFIKDMTRYIHTSLVKDGIRDEVTIVASGGIALAEHMAKEIICGADAVTIDMPLLIGLECRFCDSCRDGFDCPAKIESIDAKYGVGRMTNLIAVWHDQLIEVMGAMGMREARRLRGETGRALFFESIEEETFGRLFGKRISA
ncbi:MAG: glutamate synthase-related protein [Syntrophorhabdaceae bacterium]|nr:glutamate synthase-related protein [Syntrophorhabdaceae bacterium]